jgi:hypothetical protein
MIAAAWFLAGCAVTAAVIAYALLAAVRPCPCPECEAERRLDRALREAEGRGRALLTYERNQGRTP